MKADKIFWGILFIFIGGIFLLENFGIIDFSWYYIWRLWPIALILIGINILLSRVNSKIGVIATVVITVIALGFVTIKGLKNGGNHANLSWTFSDHDGDADSSSLDGEESTSTFVEDYDAKYKTATLNIKGGASQFEIKNTTDKLFQSDLKETTTRYYLRKTDTDTGVVLDFNTKNKKGDYNFQNNEFSEVNMMLNTQPIWDVNLAMGAGSVDFDLSAFKVKSVNLKGGAASFDLKIGDLFNQVNLVAETGVAEVKISVPESMGCQIITSTGLSSKDFKGFVKKSNGTYETSNYNSAPKKVNIILKGGLSDLNVNRY
jgi:hypothetical protein